MRWEKYKALHERGGGICNDELDESHLNEKNTFAWRVFLQRSKPAGGGSVCGSGC